MAETERITAAVTESLQALGLVDTHVRAAMEHADYVTTQMYSSGFSGVASHVSQVRQVLEEVAATITAIAQQHEQGTSVLGRVGSGSTPEEVVSHLSTVQSCIAGARQGLMHVAEGIDRAKTLALTALHGGAPEELVARIGAALEYVAHSYQVLETGNEAASAQITAARNAGK